MEIVSELITWCVEKENFDAAIKISNEVEDWVDKRTQTILRMDELLEDVATQKRDIIFKRRKRSLFWVEKATSEPSRLKKLY